MSTHLENGATLVAEARPDNEGYTMSQHTEYKTIQGRPSLIEEKLNELSKDGWRPVTMSSLSLAAFVAVILERETSFAQV